MPINNPQVISSGVSDYNSLPFTSGGTTYYHQNPLTSATIMGAGHNFAPPPVGPQCSQYPPPIVHDGIANMPHKSVVPTVGAHPSTNVTMRDLADLLTMSQKNPLPDWKLSVFNGDPLQWHEWIDQFRTAIDSQRLTDTAKLTYLKTLVSGKAKSVITEFAYCGAMYHQALRALEAKFGQPQAVVGAHLDKLKNASV